MAAAAPPPVHGAAHRSAARSRGGGRGSKSGTDADEEVDPSIAPRQRNGPVEAELAEAQPHPGIGGEVVLTGAAHHARGPLGPGPSGVEEDDPAGDLTQVHVPPEPSAPPAGEGEGPVVLELDE